MRKGTKDLSSERLAFVEACVDQCADAKVLTRSTLWNLLQMDLGRIRSGNYADAVSSLCHLIRETQSPAAYILLTEARARMGQSDLALVTLDVLGYVEPGYVEARLMRGLILCEQGTMTEAREALQSVFRVKPSIPLAWQDLIDIALEQGYPAREMISATDGNS
jgi:predicted Zn-dependent protease